MNLFAIPSLRWRLVAVMCVAYVVVAGATELVSYNAQQTGLRHQLETQARADAFILAAGAAVPLRTYNAGDLKTLRHFVASVTGARSVSYSAVYGGDGRLLYFTPPRATRRSPKQLSADLIFHPRMITLSNGDVEAVALITDQTGPLGLAMVIISGQSVQNDLRTTLLTDLLLRGIGLVVFVLLTLATAQYILGPLTVLSRAARAIRHGDMSARVPAGGQTELATVAAAFNDMASALEERITHLSFLASAAPVLPSTLRDHGDVSPTLEEFCRQLHAAGVGLIPAPGSDGTPIWFDAEPGDQSWRPGAVAASERIIGPTTTLAHDRSFIAVPVLGDTIFVTARYGSRPFSQEEQQVITNFAYQLGVASDNALLFESQQEALRVKDQFLSIVSHELRTPLTTIKGYAQILRSKLTNEPNEQRFAVNIDAQVSRLSRLVDDLLDVTRFSRGQFELQRQRVDLRLVLDDVVGRFRIVAPRYPIELSLDGGSYEGVWDRDRLEQVMNNLVGNAVKYSPPESPITIRTMHEGDTVTISVIDRGTGISEEDQDRLFERFFRGMAGTSQVTGLGLGLYVTRRIIEAHGGAIGVRSKPGEGSEFYFTLPLVREAAVASSPATAETHH